MFGHGRDARRITADEQRTCKDCGNTFTAKAGIAKNDLRYYCCDPCVKLRRNRNTSAFLARRKRLLEEKVRVIGTDPDLPLQERNDLRACYWDSVFCRYEFEQSVQAGCMNGLLVVVNNQQFYVRKGQMVEATA